MDTLIGELGFKSRKSGAIIIAALVAGGVAATLLATHLLTLIPGISPAILQIVLWVVWFGWLGWWFPRQREARLASDAPGAYRSAFWQDILPGIWLGFAQLGRPILVALLAIPSTFPGFIQIVLGGPPILVGAALIAEGHHASDIAGTMFLHEYRLLPEKIVTRGIYKVICHPMFLGGVLVSCGVGIVTMDDALWLGLINLLALPAYDMIEDQRLVNIYGPVYKEYRRSVGGFLSRVRFPVPR